MVALLSPVSFDDLVGLGQQCRRDRQAKRVRRFHIDDYLEFRRLLHRQIRRICALDDLVHEGRGPFIKCYKV